jgi:23S rRNA (cytosine1962-C5)-methyltransferase
MTKTITLKPTKERSAKRFHPWIFSGAISRAPNDLQDGDIVKVVSADDEVLGYGFFGSSSISVKLCSFGDQPLTPSLWHERISSAFKLRSALNLTGSKETTMYRLVNAEGDYLPGLIIDVYGNAAVVHCHHAGYEAFEQEILAALNKVAPFLDIIYWKNVGGESEGGKYIKGSKPEKHIALENGNSFAIDWESGQKTGFFIDQRGNRKLIGELSKNRKVLNAFSYSGGFSIYSLKNGATLVDSVDSSEKATQLCNENIELNKLTNHKAIKADCLTYLRDIEGKYDLIVLDPPAFAKHKNAVDGALSGYRDINRLAFKALPSGGILATFSCSQLVSKDMFQESVFSAAAQVGKSVQIIYRLSQSEDHPVSIYHREGEYLKGLVLRVI